VVDEAQILRWLNAKEDEHVEFKEKKQQIDSNDLGRYCVALANERGGHLVLGVSSKIPRKLVGTGAVGDPAKTKQWLLQQTGMRIEIDERSPEGKRLVVLTVPSRPTGKPLDWKGAFLMRCGESLVPMTTDQLEKIFAEKTVDYSAEVCPRAVLSDLDPRAIAELRRTWHKKSRNDDLLHVSDEQLLSQAELAQSGGLTHAALVLLATTEALGKHLPQAEIIFEYRSRDESLEHQQRIEFRRGFFLIHDELWQRIDNHNELQHHHDGLFVWDVPAFGESVAREAILNAVSHRDYRRHESVLVRQYPRRLEVISPGGLPEGITTQNILFSHAPRNRRIAEVLQKCGLVERSGQGVRRMFEQSIRDGKQRPDFEGTDDYRVSVSLDGQIRHPEFLRFLERVGQERLKTFSTEDLLVLDRLREGERLPDRLKQRLPRLLDLGAIERIGRGRGTRYILSKRLYTLAGKKGTYTRDKGLDRETNKELILRHLREQGAASMGDLLQVVPQLSRGQIYSLLQSLRRRNKVGLVGRKRGSRWKLASE
jgi:ATP-dependent DNA helicase RecG